MVEILGDFCYILCMSASPQRTEGLRQRAVYQGQGTRGITVAAEKKMTYSELEAAYGSAMNELSVMKRDRVNRQAKNSVFLNLFMRKEYQIQLYKELFPQDTTITEDDLELVTLETVLTNHPYNDLGLMARAASSKSIWGSAVSGMGRL